MNVIVNGRVARSEAGKLYFYHRKTRKTQWHMPEDGIIVNIKISQNCSNLFQSQGHKKAVDVSKMEFEKNAMEVSNQNGGATTANVMKCNHTKLLK